MSGAAALSAAKRRRGGGQINQPSSPSQKPESNVTAQQGATRITPLQMLQQHNVRISQLEEDSNTNKKQHTNEGGSVDIIDDLRMRIDTLERNANVAQSNEVFHDEEPKEDLAYYKNKIKNLEQQISELKQMMLKIQTYAMETSMSLIKYKNGMEIQEQEPIIVEQEPVQIDSVESEPPQEPPQEPQQEPLEIV